MCRSVVLHTNEHQWGTQRQNDGCCRNVCQLKYPIPLTCTHAEAYFPMHCSNHRCFVHHSLPFLTTECCATFPQQGLPSPKGAVLPYLRAAFASLGNTSLKWKQLDWGTRVCLRAQEKGGGVGAGRRRTICTAPPQPYDEAIPMAPTQPSLVPRRNKKRRKCWWHCCSGPHNAHQPPDRPLQWLVFSETARCKCIVHTPERMRDECAQCSTAGPICSCGPVDSPVHGFLF